MSLKNAYEPLPFASLPAIHSPNNEIILFHVPEGVDINTLDGLILHNIDSTTSTKKTITTFTTAQQQQQYEVQPVDAPPATRILVPSSSSQTELSFLNKPISRAFHIRLSHPSYRSSHAPSLSTSSSATSTSAPSSAAGVGRAASLPGARVKPEQPWDRLTGSFKPAGSNSTGPLPPSTSAHSDLPPPTTTKQEPTTHSETTDTSPSKSKKKKDPSSPSKGKKREREDEGGESSSSPKKSKGRKSEGKGEEKKKKRKSE
ncbi:hypothetical protein A4X13_0g2599 [Tilletia indica]|uniref:Uncharacterized protein n=1 Tax=Tilletia indica TaxID=43049 RepID=A0A177TZD8_9BASI|nr:hypothetical protein A4X13_0g2599 [Tilletia indica]